jgi:predicted transglutaminase-like cysteine proteinase
MSVAAAALAAAGLAACATTVSSLSTSGAAPTAKAQRALPPMGYLALCVRTPEVCYDSSADGPVQIAATAHRLSEELGGRRATSRPAAIRTKGSWSGDHWASFFKGADSVESLAQERTKDAPAADLTPDVWAILHEVNETVNRKVVSRSDRQIFGVSDYWALPFDRNGAPLGDCEDFVLQKRQVLLARGLPPSALSIAIVKIVDGTTHAVLLVETNNGVYVLDSLSPWIRAADQVRYQWLEHQVKGEAFNWAFGLPSA